MLEDYLCEACGKYPAAVEIEDSKGRGRLVCAVCHADAAVRGVQAWLKEDM